jgi:hypothetical protein
MFSFRLRNGKIINDLYFPFAANKNATGFLPVLFLQKGRNCNRIITLKRYVQRNAAVTKKPRITAGLV